MLTIDPDGIVTQVLGLTKELPKPDLFRLPLLPSDLILVGNLALTDELVFDLARETPAELSQVPYVVDKMLETTRFSPATAGAIAVSSAVASPGQRRQLTRSTQ